ncbi:5-hydroxytryptamine receptor 1B-like [Ptychodera flava]|uniref:5-hydroxytryptamine receptor 1B-like n=1 Tax=Ptychodera flava TaxID=63121 RepID=UPI003969DA94
MNNSNASSDLSGNHTANAGEFTDSINAHAWMQVLLIWIIVSVSLATNSMVLVILIKKPKLRTVSNLLVFNLTITDLALCIATAPFVTAAVLVDDWKFGNVLCQVVAFSSLWCLCALLWTIFVISLNRFYMIVHAQNYAAKFTKQRAKTSICLLWIVSMVTAVPPLIGWGEYSYDRGKSICFLNARVDVSYTIFYITVSTFLPFIFMVYCYWNIFLVVRQNSRRIKNTAKALIQTSALVIAEGTGSPHYSTRHGVGKADFLPGVADLGVNPRLGLPSNSEYRRFSNASLVSRTALLQPPQERQEQAKLTRMLGFVFAIYLLLWMPFAITILVEATAQVNMNKIWDRVSLFCVYLQTCCNPIVYGLINETYRKVFCEALCCRVAHSTKSRRQISVIGVENQSGTLVSLERRSMAFQYSRNQVSLPSCSDKSVTGERAFVGESNSAVSRTDAAQIESLFQVRQQSSDTRSDSSKDVAQGQQVPVSPHQSKPSAVRPTVAWSSSVENRSEDVSIADLHKNHYTGPKQDGFSSNT